MQAYQEIAKDAAYNVSYPFVQEVLVSQAIATLEDEDRREKLRLRYKDGWTLEYVAALLAKWESSQACVDQQGQITHRARKQVSAQVNGVQQPPPQSGLGLVLIHPFSSAATAAAPRSSGGFSADSGGCDPSCCPTAVSGGSFTPA